MDHNANDQDCLTMLMLIELCSVVCILALVVDLLKSNDMCGFKTERGYSVTAGVDCWQLHSVDIISSSKEATK